MEPSTNEKTASKRSKSAVDDDDDDDDVDVDEIEAKRLRRNSTSRSNYAAQKEKDPTYRSKRSEQQAQLRREKKLVAQGQEGDATEVEEEEKIVEERTAMSNSPREQVKQPTEAATTTGAQQEPVEDSIIDGSLEHAHTAFPPRDQASSSEQQAAKRQVATKEGSTSKSSLSTTTPKKPAAVQQESKEAQRHHDESTIGEGEQEDEQEDERFLELVSSLSVPRSKQRELVLSLPTVPESKKDHLIKKLVERQANGQQPVRRDEGELEGELDDLGSQEGEACKPKSPNGKMFSMLVSQSSASEVQKKTLLEFYMSHLSTSDYGDMMPDGYNPADLAVLHGLAKVIEDKLIDLGAPTGHKSTLGTKINWASSNNHTTHGLDRLLFRILNKRNPIAHNRGVASFEAIEISRNDYIHDCRRALELLNAAIASNAHPADEERQEQDERNPYREHSPAFNSSESDRRDGHHTHHAPHAAHSHHGHSPAFNRPESDRRDGHHTHHAPHAAHSHHGHSPAFNRPESDRRALAPHATHSYHGHSPAFNGPESDRREWRSPTFNRPESDRRALAPNATHSYHGHSPTFNGPESDRREWRSPTFNGPESDRRASLSPHQRRHHADHARGADSYYSGSPSFTAQDRRTRPSSEYYHYQHHPDSTSHDRQSNGHSRQSYRPYSQDSDAPGYENNMHNGYDHNRGSRGDRNVRSSL